jgi:CRISPR-associated protein Csd2
VPDAIYCDSARRHDFVLLFDVTDGNPNGDPDAGNLPRVDPETMQGIVTDVCLKRKVRNFVALASDGVEGNRIYVQDQVALNTLHEEGYEKAGKKDKAKNPSRGDVADVRKAMCRDFYDVRMFGAVMSTKVNAGQVRGPLQMTFSRSIDRVIPLDLSITRIAITRPEDMSVVESETEGEGKGKNKTTEMGRKPFVPYGLYKGYGFFSAPLAAQTGASADDLALFWNALQLMWDQDHSASRGLMACRGLYVFTHENGLGNAPSHALFDRLDVKLKDSVEAPRHFSDYTVAIREDGMPSGVTLTRLVG